MNRWFNPKLLAASFCVMCVIQAVRLNRVGLTSDSFGEALGAIIGGGLFWGFVATLIQRKFFKG